MTVIYVDILLVINLAVDYLVLFGTARLAGAKFERLKGLLGAAVGAVYSLVIFLDFSKAFFAITKIAVSMLMIFIAFGKRKAGDVFRFLTIFYICGFLFSGFMMFLNYVIKSDSFFIKGGIVYFDISAMEIVGSSMAALLVAEILKRLFRRGEPEGAFIARIFFGGKSTVLKGFTDTGNMLSDPLSGVPVAVASPSALENILPQKMLSAMMKPDLSMEYKLHLIPCKTVSDSVLMAAFRPDKMIVKNAVGEFETEDVLVAVSKNVPDNTIIIGKNIILKENGKVFSEV